MNPHRPLTHFLPCDKLAIGYLGITGLIFLFFAYKGLQHLQFSIVHGLSIGLIWWMATLKQLPHPMQVLRYCYPVLLIALIYFEVQLLSEMIYEPHFSYDTLVKEWDAFIFGSNPHTYWHEVMPGRLWAEFWHFMYLTYYPLLIGSFIWVWARRPGDFPRFAFVYLGIFITFILCFVLFPVYGPMEFRGDRFNKVSFFSRVISFLFEIGESNGGAFPSSHVGQSVGIYLLLRPINRYMKILIGVIIAGIALSMIYGSIHYAIDAAAGVLAGWLFYVLWDWIYCHMEWGEEEIDGGAD
ncbi:MAG: phosphatase PAP2 family protein [Balneolaceae bacterium]|nr:phosphatase PAP2 family protein [Balneolaceae bacterium]